MMSEENKNVKMVFADDVQKSDHHKKLKVSHTLYKKPMTGIPWKLLVVDDDESVHLLTSMVLADYSFENRPLMIIKAYSSKEALDILKREEDIAVILLDVVMETDDAGLKCVRAIREDLNNHIVRIVLRTGQPGQAPEQEVITNYDINDYKSKTELTSKKLLTSITSSLRSYKQISIIEQNRRGLGNIINAASSLFNSKSNKHFANGILQQLTAILQLDEISLSENASSFWAYQDAGQHQFKILSATGDYVEFEDYFVDDVVSKEVMNSLMDAISCQGAIFTDYSFAKYFSTTNDKRNLLFFQWHRPLSDVERSLISIFSTNVVMAFENISLNNEILDIQLEMIYTMSEVVEWYSIETGAHVRRVGAVVCMLARKLGLSEHDVKILGIAAPMHDIGKIGVPQEILKKPGKLTVEEFDVMKEHAELGYDIFRCSGREMLSVAATIAHQHHEKWNGKGYPQGLKGEEIHLFGRITALADVVDALISHRCYKDPWELEDVIIEIKKGRGEHFDPRIVDMFLNSLDEYYEILARYPL